MFKRLFWLVMGAGFGFGASFWVMRFVRETVERYTPERVSADLSNAVRGLGADLRAAVAEGRDAMREREAELRAQLEARAGSTTVPMRHDPRLN
jgi:hypothetical protein